MEKISKNKHTKKLQANAALSGRSMVEMLGVLAIIGVLSVGAMSGYSKAMMKYKLNKQAEQLSTLFNEAAIYAKQFTFNNSQSNYVTPTFIKLGLVPVEMIKGGNSNYIYDIFNNQISITKRGKTANVEPDVMSVSITYNNKENPNDIAMCRNVIIAIKENAAILYRMGTHDAGGGPSPSKHTIYSGYDTCDEFNCISDLTFTKIDDMCRGFAEDYPQIVISASFR